MRTNKYKAKRTNGFPSKLESALYDKLCFYEKAKEITDIKRQQTVVLQEGSKDQRITWKVDFSFYDLALKETVYAEAKGIETNDYKLKLKLWKKLKPARLLIYKGNYRKIQDKTEVILVLMEIIEKDEERDINKHG